MFRMLLQLEIKSLVFIAKETNFALKYIRFADLYGIYHTQNENGANKI